MASFLIFFKFTDIDDGGSCNSTILYCNFVIFLQSWKPEHQNSIFFLQKKKKSNNILFILETIFRRSELDCFVTNRGQSRNSSSSMSIDVESYNMIIWIDHCQNGWFFTYIDHEMTRKSVKFKNLNGEVVGMLLQMSGLRSCLAWSLKFQGDFQEVQHCFPICIPTSSWGSTWGQKMETKTLI